MPVIEVALFGIQGKHFLVLLYGFGREKIKPEKLQSLLVQQVLDLRNCQAAFPSMEK